MPIETDTVKSREKRSAWFVPAIIVILLTPVAWVAIALVVASHPTLTHVEATLQPVAAVQGRVLKVTGTTDLPDGAVLSYYFLHELASLQGQEPEGGATAVRNGRFAFTTDFAGWPGGAITLYVEFGVGSGWEQPQVVIDRFGAYGERLAGPQAHSDSGDPPTLSIGGRVCGRGRRSDEPERYGERV